MMEMADIPKFDLGYDQNGLKEENMNKNTQKISVLDHINGFQYSSSEKSDNFVIDMESFSNGDINNKNNNNIINPNSRITLQRNLSRKGSVRVIGGGGGAAGGGGCGGAGVERKINFKTSSNDRDTIVCTASPREFVGPSMPEKASLLASGPTDHSISNAQVHHQITINTSSNMNSSPKENRCVVQRNSFKRSPFSLTIDPKRVLFFFATISSLGTMLLIYFTLSMGKFGGEDVSLN